MSYFMLYFDILKLFLAIKGSRIGKSFVRVRNCFSIIGIPSIYNTENNISVLIHGLTLPSALTVPTNWLEVDVRFSNSSFNNLIISFSNCCSLKRQRYSGNTSGIVLWGSWLIINLYGSHTKVCVLFVSW